MKQIFRGGRGMPFGKGEHVIMLSCEQGLYECPKEQSNRLRDRLSTMSPSGLLHFVTNDERILNRNDDTGRNNVSRILMIFCVLFSSLVVSPALGQEARGLNKVQSPLSASVDQGQPYNYSLCESVTVKPYRAIKWIKRERDRYPKVNFDQFPFTLWDIDDSLLPQIQIGQLLPDVVLDMPLRVVNDAYARDTLTLRSCMDRPWIILDIWTEWCHPCLLSMNKWEELAKHENSFTLLGVYSSPEMHRAMPEARKKGYLSAQVIGPVTSILGQVFFHGKYSLGPSIWIKNGRFFGISEPGTLKDEDYHLLLSGKLNAIPVYAQWKPMNN